MSDKKTILLIDTYDTKWDEMEYLESCIKGLGANTLTMDVSVLGDPPNPADISKHDVASAAGSSIEEAISFNSENKAMQMMAAGSSKLCGDLYKEGKFDGMIAMGGTMATDLALDCAQAIPLGVPKYIISTVAFSPIIPAHRLSADIQMILWAGGLFGLNSVCRGSLSQGAGAVVGAAKAVEAPKRECPMVGMTSLGSSCLKYMKKLKPALENRGFEVAVFHSTGMGGMAFESLAREGAFAAVMDFGVQELGNFMAGSVVNAGEDRMLNAGKSGIPQLVAPGAIDLIDIPTWQERPARLQDLTFHDHNRLITSAVIGAEQRRETAREIGKRLAQSKGPVHFILPNQGIEEWDREGGDAYAPDDLQAFLEEMRASIKPPVRMTEIDAHINDQEFCDTALQIFDAWVEDGTISREP